MNIGSLMKLADAAWHVGTRFQCPVCGCRSRSLRWVGADVAVLRLLQVTGAGRRPAACRLCRSTDRERLIYLYLKHESGLKERGAALEILHLAPEKHVSRLLISFSPKRYERGDLHAPGYKYDNGVKEIDVTSLPYPDDSFDLVICNHVLEHVHDDARAIGEVYRVLRSNGMAILQVPLAESLEKTRYDPNVENDAERRKLYGQYDHVRLYGLDYQARLEAAGFVASRHDLAVKYPRSGLNTNETLFVWRKEG